MALAFLNGVWQFGGTGDIFTPENFPGNEIEFVDLTWSLHQPSSNTDTTWITFLNNSINSAVSENRKVFLSIRGNCRSIEIMQITSFVSKTGTGPWLVTLGFDQMTPAPRVGARYSVTGNSNSAYNKTNTTAVTCTASTSTTITLSYPTDPGTWGSGTTTVKNTDAIGVQTAPDWMRSSGYPGHSSFENIFWTKDIYTQTTFLPYDPSNPTSDPYTHIENGVRSWIWHYHKWISQVMGYTTINGGASYYTHTYNGVAYKMPEHPLVIGIPIKGFGGNSEEFVGTVATNIRNNPSIAAGTLRHMKRWGFYLGGVNNPATEAADLPTQRTDLSNKNYNWKAAFNNTNQKPWEGFHKEMISHPSMGWGWRGGVIDSFLPGAYTPGVDGVEQPNTIEQYKNSNGVVQTASVSISGAYPCYLILNESSAYALTDQTTSPRQSREENEEYGSNVLNNERYRYRWSANGSLIYPNVAPFMRSQQSYRMSLLRSLTLLNTNLAIERPDSTIYSLYGGHTVKRRSNPSENITLMNPPMLNWYNTMQGHRVTTVSGNPLITKTPEVFSCLIRAYTKGANKFTGAGYDTLEINNIEHFVKQREYFNDSNVRNYGTTVTMKRGYGVNDTDSDYPGTSYGVYATYTGATGTVRVYTDPNGYPFYPTNASYQGVLDGIYNTIWLARMGTNIGFEIDSRWLDAGVNSGLAFKIVYHDINNTEFRLQYYSDAGTTIQTKRVTGITRSTGKVRTVTFFVNNLHKQPVGNASFWINCISPNVPIMCVRVIKV